MKINWWQITIATTTAILFTTIPTSALTGDAIPEQSIPETYVENVVDENLGLNYGLCAGFEDINDGTCDITDPAYAPVFGGSGGSRVRISTITQEETSEESEAETSETEETELPDETEEPAEPEDLFEWLLEFYEKDILEEPQLNEEFLPEGQLLPEEETANPNSLPGASGKQSPSNSGGKNTKTSKGGDKEVQAGTINANQQKEGSELHQQGQVLGVSHEKSAFEIYLDSVKRRFENTGEYVYSINEFGKYRYLLLIILTSLTVIIFRTEFKVRKIKTNMNKLEEKIKYNENLTMQRCPQPKVVTFKKIRKKTYSPLNKRGSIQVLKSAKARAKYYKQTIKKI